MPKDLNEYHKFYVILLYTTNHDGKFRRFVNGMPVLHSSTFRGTAFLVLAAALVMALAAGAMLHAGESGQTIVPHQSADDTGLIPDLAAFAPLLGYAFAQTPPDDTPPTFVSSGLNLTAGNLAITFSKAIDVTPAANVVPSKIHVRESGSYTGGVTLTAGELGTTADGATISFTLNDAHLAAVAAMGKPELTIDPGAVRDTSGNLIVGTFDASTRTFVDATSIKSQERSPTGMAFSSDGTKMFVIGDSSNAVNEYALSAPFDVSTRTFIDSVSVVVHDIIPTGMAFSSDGTRLFMIGISRDKVNEYHLPVPFAFSSGCNPWNACTFTGGRTIPPHFPERPDATFVFDGTSIRSQEVDPRGMAFSNDGTKMFVIGIAGKDVNEYTLSAPFDASTRTFVDATSISEQEDTPTGIAFSSDGAKMFVIGDEGDDVNEYTLSAPFDASTRIFVDATSVSEQETVPTDIAFSNDGAKMFVLGTTDNVIEYNLSSVHPIEVTGTASQSQLTSQLQLTTQSQQASAATLDPVGTPGPRDIGRIILTSATPGTIDASWVAPSEAPANYRISWAKVGDPYLTWTDSTGNAFPTDLAHTITGLEAGETYNVKVRASYSGTAGDWSGDVTITIAETATNTIAETATNTIAETATNTIAVPGTPVNIGVSPGSSSTLDVSWQAPAFDGGSSITGYTVQWKAASGDWTVPSDVSEAATTGTSHTITGLTNGTTYAVRVFATNSIGDGVPSAESMVTQQTPQQPLGSRDIGRIILTSTAPGTMEASWVAPSEAPANYRISWAKVGDPYLTWTDSTGNAFPTDLAHTITGLEAGETYNVKVRASYSGTAGDWSGDVTITIAEAATNTIAVPDTPVTTVVTDTTAPTISSIERYSPSSATTDSQTLTYKVTFSEDVTGVDKADFALSSDSTGETNGNNPVTSISGSGSVYYAEVSASTDGTYNLDLVQSGHGIADTASNQLANTTPTGADETYTFITAVTDSIAPTVSSIERYNPSSATTDSQTLTYKVTFSEDVTGVGTADFALSSDSTGETNGNNPVTSISGSGSVYYATVSVTTDGTYNLDLVSSGHGIADTASNPLANTTPTGADETYTFITAVTDSIAPTVSSIERYNPSSATTDSQTLTYKVTFSEDVTGVGTADFALSSDSTGETNGNNPVTSISGSGSVYYATVSVTTDGTYNLDLVSSGHGIADTASNQLTNTAPTGADQTYTVSTTVVNTTNPRLESIERYSPTSQNTNIQYLIYKATFSKSVTGVGASDFVLSPGSTGGGNNGISPIAGISGSSDTYYVIVFPAVDGTYNLDLVSSGHNIADAASNPLTNTAPTGADQTYTVS